MTRFPRRTFVAGTVGTLLVPSVARAGAGRARLAAVAQEVAAAGREELAVPALAIGVLSREGSHVAGAGDAGTGAPPTGDTLFQIASVTKPFTALALARAVASGRMRLDDPLTAHLPDGWKVPERRGRAITLEHLATATSGLPRLPPGAEELPGFDPADPYAHLDRADVKAALASTRLSSTPGERFRYSNFGSGLLGIALGHDRGSSYGELVRAQITRPLGMRDTVITPSGDQVGRRAAGFDATGAPAVPWRLPALAGAGALWSTADDLLRFLRAHLELRPAPMARALRTVRTPRARVDRRTRIGLAWFRQRVPDAGPVAFHNGQVGGYAAFVAYAPEAGVAAVALGNTPKPVDAAGIAALRALARGA
jgi:CubicO group peptidase (beta-lactamase class C family)